MALESHSTLDGLDSSSPYVLPNTSAHGNETDAAQCEVALPEAATDESNDRCSPVDTISSFRSDKDRIEKLEGKLAQVTTVLDHVMMSTSRENVKEIFALHMEGHLRREASIRLQDFEERHGHRFDTLWDELGLGDVPQPFYWSTWLDRLLKISRISQFLAFPDCSDGHNRINAESMPLVCRECRSPDCQPICSYAPFHVFVEKLEVAVLQNEV